MGVRNFRDVPAFPSDRARPGPVRAQKRSLERGPKDARGAEAELLRGGRGQVPGDAAAKRPAVDHGDGHEAAVVVEGDACATRERAVRDPDRAAAEPDTAGGALAVEAGAVPRRLQSPHQCDQSGARLWTDDAVDGQMRGLLEVLDSCLRGRIECPGHGQRAVLAGAQDLLEGPYVVA